MREPAGESRLVHVGQRVGGWGRMESLFLHDNRVVARSQGLQRVMGEVRKHSGNPILVADRPWEAGFVGYACVIYDGEEKLYKMWYESRLNPGQLRGPDLEQGRCLYATSGDGLVWEKPILGIVESDGSRENNIVFAGPEGARNKVYWVIKDRADPNPARRYKMMFHLWDFRGRGVGIAYSADGLHWKTDTRVNLHGGFDTHNIFFWDDRVGQYVGYFRTRMLGRRFIARATSPDAFHWSHPVSVHGPDEDDPRDFDLYTPGVFKYSRAADTYVLYTAAFDRAGDRLFGQLAVSRDGIDWHRFRAPFLPLGSEGEWDAGSIYPSPSEVSIGSYTAVYYRGDHIGHGAGGRPGIGVAFLDQGGFVAWEAATRGTLTTHPLAVGGNRETLYVNGDAAGGSIRAELLDSDGEVVRGYSRQESVPIIGKGSKLLVRWREKPSLGDAVLKPFRLKLYLERARVYGLGSTRP